MSTIELVLNQPWVARLGWTLVHFLWQGTVIAVLLAAARALVGRWLTDHGRYVLACVALGFMMITPLLTFLAAGRLGTDAVPAPLWRVSGGDAWRWALPWLVVAWASGVGVFSARLIGGWRLTVRLRSVAVGPAPREWQQTLEELIYRLRVSAPVRLLTSSLVAVPTVVGWLRPVILVPVEALIGLPVEQVRALLAHELAHIRRHDYLVNIVQSIAEAVLFYHPAVWWVSDQIRTERELCCDDLAVAASGDVLVYALALADLDSRRRARLKAALAADGGSLVNRIRRLVGQSQPLSHTLPGPGAAWALVLLWVAGIGAVTVHGAPDSSPSPRNFMPPPPVVARNAVAAPLTLEPPVAPVLTALLYDPFFAPSQAQAPAPAAERQNARVEGIILTLAGDPVRGATVRLWRAGASVTSGTPNAYSSITDDTGRFAIEDVPPGSYTLSAAKTGFVTGRYGAKAPGGEETPISLPESAAMKDVEIKLTPEAVVTGKLTDQDREPRSRTVVCLRDPNAVRDVQRTLLGMPEGYCASTNALGRFAIGEVPPGQYVLVALPSSTSPYVEPGSKDVATYYPSAPDARSGVPVKISAGMRLEGMDIRLRRVYASYKVNGRALLRGSPLRNSRLMLISSAGSSQVIPVQDGAFEATGVVPGSYTLKVVPNGVMITEPGSALGLSGSVEFAVRDGDVKGVVLALEPGVEIAGAFKLEDGSPLASQPGPRPQVGLKPADGTSGGTPGRMKDDGTFLYQPVAAGSYLLDIGGLPPEAYVKSVRYGPRDVTRSPLDVVSGGGTLDIVVSLKAATVTGAVRNDLGEPMSGIRVTVWPKDPNPGTADHGVRTASTAQTGGFLIAGLAPGEYFVAAWEEIESGLARNLDFLKAFASQAAPVKVEEGSHSQAAAGLKLVRKDRIAAEAERVRQ